MKLLDRYLLRQFIRQFLLVSSGFSAIYLLVEFMDKIDNFTKAGKSMGLVAKYFILSIPFIIDQLGPILIMLAGIISLGILNHTNEMTALKAGGIPLRKIIRPFIIGSVLFTGLLIGAAQWLLPYTISTTNQIWNEQVRGKLQLGIYRSGRFYFKGEEGFYSFEWPDRNKLTFKNFSYSQWNEEYNTNGLVAAGSAVWDKEKKIWLLENVQLQQKSTEGEYTIKNLDRYEVTLPEQPIDFMVSEYEYTEKSLFALYTATKTEKTKGLKRIASIEFYKRISYILLGIPLLILGLPTLLYTYRKWGQDLSVAIPASCGLAFVAWGIWGALQSLASAGYLSPIIAGSALHIVFTLFGIMLLQRQNRF